MMEHRLDGIGRGSLRLALVAVMIPAAVVGAERPASTGIVEIRSYNLEPGTRDRFHMLSSVKRCRCSGAGRSMWWRMGPLSTTATRTI
jgi:hypothetical protein